MKSTALILLAAISAPALAQESYWVSTGSTIDQVTPSGDVLGSIALPGSGGGAVVAPDGKVWCPIRFSSDVVIYDPATGTQTTVTTSMGWVIHLAFDSSGHAWVTGIQGPTTLIDAVEEYDATGALLGTYPVAPQARDITIDSNDNKWIAHRDGPPCSITQIAATTNVVTNIPMPANSLILPIGIRADDRGLFNQSHIWITGDNRGAGELIEYDPTTTPPTTTVYVVDVAGRFGPPLTTAIDTGAMTGTVWVTDWGAGTLHDVNPFTGVIRNTYTMPNGGLGMALDGFGRLWVSGRNPAVLQRINQSTGALEVPVTLGGIQGALATRYQYAAVVDPFGDLDLDGIANTAEIGAGVSPFDVWSNGLSSITTNGSTQIGSTCSLDVTTSTPGTFWALAYSAGLVAPGSGFTVPGIAGELLLDPVVALAGSISGVGSMSLPVAIPNDPALQGGVFQAQGFAVTSSLTAQFTNITSFVVY